MYKIGRSWATKTCEHTGNVMFTVRDGRDIAWLTMTGYESRLYRHLTNRSDSDGVMMVLAMATSRCEAIDTRSKVVFVFNDN